MKVINEKKTCISVVSFLLASLTVLAYNLNLHVATLPESITSLSIYGNAIFRFLVDLAYSLQIPTWYTVLICVAIAYLYRERLFVEKNIKSKIIVTVVSAIIVFALLLCYSYSKINSWDLVFGGKIVFAKSLIKLLGFTPIVYIVVDYLINLNPTIVQEEGYSSKPFKTIAIMMILFMICWIPYFILLYPGCVSADAFDQLAQALNNSKYCWTDDTIVLLDESVILNNHHPILYTGVLKLTTLLAEVINSYENAFEILCILQGLLLAFSFAYMIYVLAKHKANKKFLIGTFMFCAFNPIFPVYAMTVIKDTLFCAIFVLTAVQLYELIILKNISVARGIAFAVTVLALLFTRNNTIYILILTTVCVVFCYWKRKKKMLRLVALIMAPLLLFQVGFINILCPAFNITQGSPREMLSVPFQQTARYIKEHRDEITPEEEKVITTVLDCDGDIDVLVADYSGQYADYIKNRFNKYATTDDLVEYVKIWVKGLMNHPLTYVEAYLNLHYGWLSFEGSNVVTYANAGENWRGQMIEEFEGYLGNSSHRALVNQTLNFLYNNPLLSVLFEMSTYTWLYLLLLFFIIKRKNSDGFIVCTLAFFNFLISLLGPIAYMRYVIPMVCIVPFAIFIVFKTKGDEKNGQNSGSDTLLQ